jgi:myosin heavy subunit
MSCTFAAVRFKVSDATDRRDCLACYLYDALYFHVITRLNAQLSSAAEHERAAMLAIAGSNPATPQLSVTLVDAFGFEFSGDAAIAGTLSQLLVNYGAEKWLWFMRDAHYRNEEALYLSEGIVFNRLPWWDNDAVVRILDSTQKPTGLFSVLEDACMYNTPERCPE